MHNFTVGEEFKHPACFPSGSKIQILVQAGIQWIEIFFMINGLNFLLTSVALEITVDNQQKHNCSDLFCVAKPFYKMMKEE